MPAGIFMRGPAEHIRPYTAKAIRCAAADAVERTLRETRWKLDYLCAQNLDVMRICRIARARESRVRMGSHAVARAYAKPVFTQWRPVCTQSRTRVYANGFRLHPARGPFKGLRRRVVVRASVRLRGMYTREPRPSIPCEEDDVSIAAYNLSRQASVVLSVRVPRSLVQDVTEAAESAGVDRSTYLRDALSRALSITAAAASKIQNDTALVERRKAASELQVVREELVTCARQRAGHTRGSRSSSMRSTRPGCRVLVLSNRILGGRPGAQQEFTELWEHLDPAAQVELVPVMYRVMQGYFFALGEALPQTSEESGWERQLIGEASWLLARMLEAPLLGRRLPSPELDPAVAADRDAHETLDEASLEVSLVRPTARAEDHDYFEVVGGPFSRQARRVDRPERRERQRRPRGDARCGFGRQHRHC